jgi:hypothetical protein
VLLGSLPVGQLVRYRGAGRPGSALVVGVGEVTVLEGSGRGASSEEGKDMVDDLWQELVDEMFSG